jgi:hypothetical protein
MLSGTYGSRQGVELGIGPGWSTSLAAQISGHLVSGTRACCGPNEKNGKE